MVPHPSKAETIEDPAKEADSQAQLDALKGPKAKAVWVGDGIVAFTAENSSGLEACRESLIWAKPLEEKGDLDKTPPPPAPGAHAEEAKPASTVAAKLLKPSKLKAALKTGVSSTDHWKLRPTFSFPGGRAVAEIYVGKSASLYGTGLVKGHLLRNGAKTPFWNTDNFSFGRDNGKRLYSTHPWVLGVRDDGSAFGVIADFSWRGGVDLRNGYIRFESDGTPFPVVIIERQSPQAVMSALRELTGAMPMPPMWALGYQQCRFSYETEKRVKDIATQFRSRHLPCDVLWMDIDYLDDYRTLTVNKERFPDPAALNDKLRQLHFRGVWMVNPGVKVDPGYSVYAAGEKAGVWIQTPRGKDYVGNVWPGPCKFPDFTSPEVRKWWSALNVEFIQRMKLDGIWNDMNEPAIFSGPDGTLPVDACHRGGDALPPGSHLRYHNVYGVYMIQATRAAFEEAHPDKRPFVLSRSNFLGGHRYGATWTGDNISSVEHMQLSIPMSLNLALSGQSFNGPDLGGFAEKCTPKLFAKWMATGAYFPFCRGHADKKTNDKEPWAFGPDVERTCRTALLRRYRLIPYLYTQFYRNHTEGLPVMQPVFFAEPANPALRGEDRSYLIGGDVMVIPSWSGKVAMPSKKQGKWREISLLGKSPSSAAELKSMGWKEKNPDGKDWDFPLWDESGKLQAKLLLRPGAILPIGKLSEFTSPAMTETLTLLVNPDPKGNASGLLYEDDGESLGYINGDFCLTEFLAKTVKGKVEVTSRVIAGNRASGVRNREIRILK